MLLRLLPEIPEAALPVTDLLYSNFAEVALFSVLQHLNIQEGVIHLKNHQRIFKDRLLFCALFVNYALLN